jgi:hypothetical protein
MDIKLLAKMWISCSDEVAQLMDDLQGDTVVSKLGAECGDWSRLYRKHRKIQVALLEHFFDFGKNGIPTSKIRQWMLKPVIE